MDCILKTNNLSKEYQGVFAVKDLNMTINKGDIYGFLGENGAGKTTTIKMIMQLIKPTEGSIELFSEKMDRSKTEFFKRIGSIIEFPGFYGNLTAAENLEIHRRMMGVQDKRCIGEALKITNILDAKDKKVKEFSLGMKQRLGIARAILHHPEFLILDEPTNGLDPSGIKEIRELILSLSKNQGITFLISTHILSEIQQMATNIGIINKGRLLEEIGYEELKKKNRNFINLKISDDKKASFILEDKMKIKDYLISEKNNIRIYEKLDKICDINEMLVSEDIKVSEISIKCDSLEDYFFKITKEQV